MKKVLILAYDFPPYVSVGGLRPYSWYKYLKEFGFHPIIITRQWTNHYGNDLDYIAPGYSNEIIVEETEYGTIVRTPYKPNLSNRLFIKYSSSKFKIFRKFISAYFEFMQFFFIVGPKANLYFGAKKYLKIHKVDFIIATGDPFVLFKYASKLSKKTNTPWLADYRDDWVDNHQFSFEKRNFKNWISRLFFKTIEKRIIKNCACISSVSEGLVQQITQRVKIKNSCLLENGADLDCYIKKDNPFQKDQFIILYSGSLYDIDYLNDFYLGWKLFINEVKNKLKIKIYFVGIGEVENKAIKKVLDLKKEYPQNLVIESHKTIEEIAQYQMHANVLLNFIAGDPSKGLIGAKSYNYAVTKNPILTIPFIKNNNSPFFPGRDIQTVALSAEEVASFLCMVYESFRNKNEITSSLTDDERFKLSRKYNTEKLSILMKDIIK